MHDFDLGVEMYTYEDRGASMQALASSVDGDRFGQITGSQGIGIHITALQLGLFLRLTRMPNLDFW
jgi:hypothetical protein